MNQILCTDKTSKKLYSSHSAKSVLYLKFQLIISIFVIILSLSYCFYWLYDYKKTSNITKKVSDNFNISLLYSNKTSSNYNTSTTPSNEQYFSVIGAIKIDKLKLSYPIFSNLDNELLKVSPCRFYGPMPNEVGNLCIAGHNFNDNRFFSKLDKLTINDSILIYDSKGNSLEYFVYDKYEVTTDDLSCTSQDTNEEKEVTLITCNNLNGMRIIIKAKNM